MVMDILRTLFDPAEPMPTDENFYEARWDEIQRNVVASQIYSILAESDSLKTVPDRFRKRLEVAYKERIGISLYMAHMQNVVLQALERFHVPAIPFKGTLFSQRYYGNVAARSSSDIDVLVPHERLADSYRALESIGFTGPYMSDPSHFQCLFQKQVGQFENPLKVEIHWSLLKEETTKIHFDHLWLSATERPSCKYARELNIQATFYVMCVHGVNHEMSTPRVFLDMVQLLYRFGQDIQFEQIMAQAKEDKVWRRIQLALTLLYHEFPDLERIKPFPWRCPLPSDPVDWEQLVDNTWYRIKLLATWVVPGPKRLLSYQLANNGSLGHTYVTFYRKRVMKFLRVISGRKEDVTNAAVCTPDSRASSSHYHGI